MRDPRAGLSESKESPRPPTRDGVAVAQGAFYLATGVWPLIDMRSFEAVTGPKTDRWLVRTVGCLVGVLGGSLLVAGLRGRTSAELAAAGAASATALGIVDAHYATRGRISRIYLLDAAVEAGIVAAWGASLLRESAPGRIAGAS